MSLFERHVDFVAELRRAGLGVSLSEDLDAVSALQHVDMLDREQLRAGYAAAVVKRQAQRPAFDTIFDLYFPRTVTSAGGLAVADSAQDGLPVPTPARPMSPSHWSDPAVERYRADLLEQLLAGDEQGLAALANEGVGRFGAVSGGAPAVQAWSHYLTMSRTSAQTLLAAFLQRALPEAERGQLGERTMRAAFAARLARFDELVRTEVQRRVAEQRGAEHVARTAVRPSAEQLDLLHATNAELAAIRREIQPLARRLAARLAIEHRRGRRGKLDVRRTIRASLSAGGVPIHTHFRPPHPTKTDLVIVCDVSDSVASFARFTLLLVYALRQQFTRVRVFAFIDELDEVTALLGPGSDIVSVVGAVDSGAKVRGWYGRTDYGRAFELFERRYLDAVTPRTTLLILGDARSNYGDPKVEVVRRIAARARRAHWLNPERRATWDTGDSCASQLANVVAMTECRNLAQLGAFVRALA